MADIELVIKISEEKYKWIKENNPKADKDSVVGVIVHGTPLPKGHGRLIDADKLWDSYYNLDYDFYEALDLADAIIESDNESE
jgi:hypothetical protein